MARASETQRMETAGLWGRKAGCPGSHTKLFLSKLLFNIFLLKDPMSPSADCSSAELLLNYAQGPLIFLTEPPPQVYSGENWGSLNSAK